MGADDARLARGRFAFATQSESSPLLYTTMNLASRHEKEHPFWSNRKGTKM